jgi:hypothetical protein
MRVWFGSAESVAMVSVPVPEACRAWRCPNENIYVEAIMDRYGIRTTTEAVDLALRHLACQPMTREEALAMRGAHVIDHVPADVAPIRPV